MPVIYSRVDVKPGDLVLSRYASYPHPFELEYDVRAMGGTLVNNASAHAFVADLGDWYPLLTAYTPKTWYRLQDVPQDATGPFVLKGPTWSRKHQWTRSMYAPTRSELADVYNRLSQDSMFERERIYIRQFVPLISYGTAIGGLPFAHEFRVFALDGNTIDASFYYASFEEDIFIQQKANTWWLPTWNEQPAAAHQLVKDILAKITNRIRFVAIDVACDALGRWWLIELNDGCMSGLCGSDPATFYSTLAIQLRNTLTDVE